MNTDNRYRQWAQYLRYLLAVIVILMIFNFWYANRESNYNQEYVNHTNELRILTQRLAKHAVQAESTETELAFKNLQDIRDDFIKELLVLTDGVKEGSEVILPPSPDSIQKNELANFIKNWKTIETKVNLILENKTNILTARKKLDDLTDTVRKIESIYWEILAIYKKENSDVSLDVLKQMMKAESLAFMLQNILDIKNKTGIRVKEFYEKSSEFISETIELQKVHTAPELQDKHAAILEQFEILKKGADDILRWGAPLTAAYQAEIDIYENSVHFLDLGTLLLNAYNQYADHQIINQKTAYGLSILAVLLILFLLFLAYKMGKEDVKITEEKSAALHKEIQQLLIELGDVAKGNLAIQATVSSGVTKEIAIAVNYALNALRRLVFDIHKTAREASSVASNAEQITQQLTKASKKQSQEIFDATTSVNVMASTVEGVSRQAGESASVALESVVIANSGGKIVRETIEGMERIQSKIQDTASKIRRLGESSLEVGEIILLIEDISDQTNILAVNASIQAAMAGETGRGFAVVADEIQRLAEKAGSATKEIKSLINTIQTETQQVTTTMEQARSEALQGVKLAQNAGSELEKIENVSKKIAGLVQFVSKSANEHAVVFRSIALKMKIINEFTEQTDEGTADIEEFIEKLNQLINDLRNSVSEFRLPDGLDESK